MARSLTSRFSMAIPDWVLRTGGKLNVPVYRLSRGRIGGRVGGAPVLLLTTTGRRSGQQRTAPVLYLRTDDGSLIVIGSNAGNDRTPAWALNLAAIPEAEVEVGADRSSVRARIAEGDERADLWRRMRERYAGFDDYRERTARDINVFVLEPR
jgi:F420H(2)-dependent quinone reductase